MGGKKNSGTEKVHEENCLKKALWMDYLRNMEILCQNSHQYECVVEGQAVVTGE